MFPASLRLLLRLRVVAFLRKLSRGMRDPRKAAVLVLTYGSSLVGVGVFAVLHSMDDDFANNISGKPVSVALAAFALLAVVSALFEFPVAYTPPEIQFLFPGPFSRAAMLTYKLTEYIPVIGFVSGIAATLLTGIGWHWFAAFSGSVLFACIILTLGVAIGLAARTPVVRPALLTTMLAASVFAAYDLLPVASRFNTAWATGEDLDRSLSALADSPTYRAALLSVSSIRLMLFNPISSPEFLTGLGASLAILAVTLAGAYTFDSRFHEVALRASARREARMARFLRGQSMRGASSVGARLHLPMLPRMGGAGPIAHRYLTAMLREKSALWMLALAVVAPFGVTWYIEMVGEAHHPGNLRWLVVGVPVYVTFIVANIVRFDFRADYVVLDYLKTLPVHPIPAAVGGVTAVTIFATTMQTLPSLVFTLYEGAAPVPLRFLFLLLPVNFIWFALDNAFFLRAPSPMRKGMNADPSEMARQIFSMMVRGFILAIVSVVIAGSYYLVGTVTGSVAAATATAWLIVLPIAVWTAYLAGVTLRDLDLSRDAI